MKSDIVYLRHMMDAINKIESYASVQKDKIADWELASNGA